MGKRGNSTATQLPLGFMSELDRDILTDLHDQIMLWLDRNVETILSERFSDMFSPQWKPDTVTGQLEQSGLELDELGEPPVRIVKFDKLWEYPITVKSGRREDKYIIGFVDFLVNVYYPQLTIRAKQWQIEYPTMIRFWFEVKTSIRLGPLIRQIRAYQEFIGKETVFTIVSPDDRYADTLRDQGIGFLKYDPESFV
jgi:hypothetical protein